MELRAWGMGIGIRNLEWGMRNEEKGSGEGGIGKTEVGMRNEVKNNGEGVRCQVSEKLDDAL